MLALDKCPNVASAENARRGFTNMYVPNASPSVKFTAAVLPGGTLLVVNTVPPTIATYGAYFCQLVKFHRQMTGLKLPPLTKKTAVLTKHIADQTKKDSAAMAHVLRTWMAESGDEQKTK